MKFIGVVSEKSNIIKSNIIIKEGTVSEVKNSTLRLRSNNNLIQI